MNAQFGTYLKERMDALGIECVVRHRDDGAKADQEMVGFFVKHLHPAEKAAEKERTSRQGAAGE